MFCAVAESKELNVNPSSATTRAAVQRAEPGLQINLLAVNYNPVIDLKKQFAIRNPPTFCGFARAEGNRPQHQ